MSTLQELIDELKTIKPSEFTEEQFKEYASRGLDAGVKGTLSETVNRVNQFESLFGAEVPEIEVEAYVQGVRQPRHMKFVLRDCTAEEIKAMEEKRNEPEH
jgi:hypothetical protein